MNVQMTQTEILRTLHEAEGHPLLESVLVGQAESRVRPRPSKEQIQSVLVRMNGSSLIMRHPNELDADNTYWLLDEKGQAMVTRMRL